MESVTTQLTKAHNLEQTFIVYDPAFYEVIGDHYSYQVLVETDAHEGPVYVRSSNELYFTTVPTSSSTPIEGSIQIAIRKVCLNRNNKIETVQEISNNANGMTLGLNNELIVCEQGSKTKPASISQISLGESKSTPVVENWFGLPFNSPNDVIVKKNDGSIWFTDPAYGYAQGFKNLPLIGNYVYRFDVFSKAIKVVADGFIRPNGLAFSPDQTILYINDSGANLGDGSSYHVDLPHHIKAFDIGEDGQLFNERLFAVVTPGIPDGLKVDTKGRVYSSCATGVKVYASTGKLLGEILAEGVANFTFGGIHNNELFICTDHSIVEVQLAATGASDYNL